MSDRDEPPPLPSLSTATKVWLRIGLLSFGGPAGQIALMHRELVDDRRWVSDARFLHALNFCTLLPGPEAMQLATYIGWLLHGVPGGLVAGTLFVLPGALVMLALSIFYALLGAVPVVAVIFFGLKCAVLVLVVEALLRVARRALKSNEAHALAFAAFLALFVFAVPFPIVVLVTALMGYWRSDTFRGGGHGTGKAGPLAAIDHILAHDPARPSMLATSAWRAGWVTLALWLVPLAALLIGQDSVFADVGWFFSKMAVVTFGGAYAVLAYVAQESVVNYRWLSAGQMLTGLGLAETTPGPLILVLQFVGFHAGLRDFGLPGAIAASGITLWMTFMPCFAWIFLGAPYIERLQNTPRVQSALAGVTAGVVGVIANLALWFGLHVLFSETYAFRSGPIALDVPVPASLDFLALILATVAALTLFRFKGGVIITLGVTAAAGLVLQFVLN
ncbi:MAG: chromate efflux transporter [Acetobacteraceae bacterium]|nr:chromate efflux transporter [Acetobacteraceae bacterium]